MNKSKSLFVLAGLGVVATAIILSAYDEISSEESVNVQEEFQETTPEKIEIVELTGTPADNYSPDERMQHCGKSDFKSNQYIQEFEIPTSCSQPLSIISDSDGNIWFTQTNTGNLVKFEPKSGEFTEYQNDKWNLKRVSMMWGITITEDEEIWFTDETNDFIWKFSIKDETYSKFDFPREIENAFPQKMEYYNGHFLINDFTGNRIVVINHEDLDNDTITYSEIKTPKGFFTSQTSVDNGGNVWFVIWKYQKDTILVKTNIETHETENFSLPSSIFAPNGVTVGPEGNVWIADTAGSSFYRFSPEDKKVMEFVTSDAPIWTFGNSSGLIKTPITRPYWNAFDSNGNMWFNQQTANRLAMFDPILESLIEYDIPSKNPGWADCGDMSDCGTAQSFGFVIQGKQVWFTEWVENNIGVLDASVPSPITISIDKDEIEIGQGEQKEIFVTVRTKTNENLKVALSGTSNSESIIIKPQLEAMLISDEPVKLPVTIEINEDTHKGLYKVLIGAQLDDVSVSSYATIKVT